jgi:hypothetical protein
VGKEVSKITKIYKKFPEITNFKIQGTSEPNLNANILLILIPVRISPWEKYYHAQL